MPCYSTITTKLTDGARLDAALRAIGYKVDVVNVNQIIGSRSGETINFIRRSKTDAFRAMLDTGNLPAISRKYAEIGVREWARKRGYSVGIGGNLAEDAPRTMTVTNRRA